MAKFTTYNLKPDVSLKDQLRADLIVKRSAVQRENKRMTRLGLNTANVQNADITRSRVPLSQRRPDYVKVREWMTREVAEQYPSIQRAKAREAEEKRDNAVNFGMFLSPFAQKVAAKLPAKIQKDAEDRICGLHVLDYLDKHNREAAKLMRRAWFGVA